MATHALPYFTPEQYLAFDRSSDTRHEYMFGDILPVEGGMPAHARITANAITAISNRLTTSGCAVYSSSLRVCVDAKFAYAYPDLSVICGQPQYTDAREDTVTNPALIVVVLSPSTEGYDLGKKARMYWKIASLTGLLFIDQKRVWIEYWFRSPGGKWDKHELESLHDTLHIELSRSDIPVSEFYAGVNLPAA
jgi:Uma2 family endonuclease